MYTEKGIVNVPVPDASCRRHVQLSRIQHHSQTVSNYKYYILVLPYFFSIVRCAAIVFDAFVS